MSEPSARPHSEERETKNRLKNFEVAFPPNITVFNEGDASDSLFYLLSGSVSVTREGKQLATITQPGTFLGEMGVLRGQPRSATVVTLTDSKFYAFPVHRLESLLQDKNLAMKFLRTMADRIDSTSRENITLARQNEEERNRVENFRKQVSAVREKAKDNSDIQRKLNGLKTILSVISKRPTPSYIESAIAYMEKMNMTNPNQLEEIDFAQLNDELRELIQRFLNEQ